MIANNATQVWPSFHQQQMTWLEHNGPIYNQPAQPVSQASINNHNLEPQVTSFNNFTANSPAFATYEINSPNQASQQLGTINYQFNQHHNMTNGYVDSLGRSQLQGFSLNSTNQFSTLNSSCSPMASTIKTNKRNSFELDDDCSSELSQRPTKQLLSERKLYRKFGSLHLNRDKQSPSSSDSDDSNDGADASPEHKSNELKQYVYSILGETNFNGNFKDNTFEKLAREERDKLNRALVLYRPPTRYNYTVMHQDDTTCARYRRHEDEEPSVIITDVTHEEDNSSEVMDSDEMMVV